jgi:hypothetical protein
MTDKELEKIKRQLGLVDKLSKATSQQSNTIGKWIPGRKRKKSRKMYRHRETIEVLIRYDGDKEVASLVKDLESKLDIRLGLGHGWSKVEFTLWGGRIKESPDEAYHLGDGRLRDVFLRLADNIREWTKEAQVDYEGFIECFGADNRREIVKLIDQHLSE